MGGSLHIMYSHYLDFRDSLLPGGSIPGEGGRVAVVEVKYNMHESIQREAGYHRYVWEGPEKSRHCINRLPSSK